MKPVQDPAETGSVSEEIYVTAVDLARVLKLTDTGLSKLARSGVLTRIQRPDDARAYLFPLLANVTAYVTYLQSAREKAYVAYIQERAKLGKAQRMRTELKHAAESGVMVDKEAMFAALSAGILAYKQALLARGERLEAILNQTHDREARVAAIRADDSRFLGLLADSLKAVDNVGNGQTS
jgi:phage terminase Nu1 subunit (DNA packaging protein)